MKRGNGKANRQKRTIWILAAVLGMTPFSAALQTSVPVSVPVPALPKAPELAKATVRWVLVSIPDRKLALIANGKVVHVYRVAVGKTSTPSPVGEFTIVSRVSNPAYYHKGQGYRRGQAEPGGHALDGTEREGLRNPRHQPAKLDRQSGIDGMHSHGQAGCRRTLRHGRRRRHGRDSRGTRRADCGRLWIWSWSRNGDGDGRAARDRIELRRRTVTRNFL
jgi:hypothetical protein